MLNNKHIISIMLGVGVVLSPLCAAPLQEQLGESPDAVITYFPKDIVERTLERFQIPKAQRVAIVSALAEKNAEVILLVEEKAVTMNPNPLRDPKYRSESVKIFRDALLEVFNSVMRTHGITDKDELKEMLNDIQQQKAYGFSQSVRNYKENSKNSEQSVRGRVNLSRRPLNTYEG